MKQIEFAKNSQMEILTAAVLFSVVLSANSAGATEADCPRWTSRDFPKLEQPFNSIDSNGRFIGEGPPFNTKSYHWQRGVWFEMPLGFRNPWLSPEHARTVTNKQLYREWLTSNRAKGYDPQTGEFDPNLVSSVSVDGQFAFWMPSTRYVERNRWKTPYFRPCETGRARSGENDYVVAFHIEWPFLPDSRDSEPGRRFRNADNDLRERGRVRSQDVARWEHSLRAMPESW